MKNLYLEGCGTALLTPFKDGQVDYQCFASLVDRQVQSGIHFLVPLGTTGETPCLSTQERIKVLQTAVEHSAGRPILVGGGTNSLTSTIESIKLLQPYGADAFLIVVPYYNKPTQEGMYEYFKAVADASEKPIVIYNVPGRTGANISAQTTLRLAEHENIIAIKEASGNYAQISEIIRNKPQGFSVLSGNDDETLSLMATGAQGVISVASNIAPKQMATLCSLLKEDRMAEARALHYSLMPLFKNCFIESNPIPAKAAMAALGLMENSLRLPLVKASAKTEQIMIDTVKELFK
ncbi:MAG: 4-hydroxy-tetrahydrodipicolinate synthase [Bacteroidales bacterium]|nr:4-hydroxy-tetrahydrodipicolinate synthase [Bacteroidales bacterium]